MSQLIDIAYCTVRSIFMSNERKRSCAHDLPEMEAGYVCRTKSPVARTLGFLQFALLELTLSHAGDTLQDREDGTGRPCLACLSILERYKVLTRFISPILKENQHMDYFCTD